MKKYKVAMYLRLSKEDINKSRNESESILNQKQMINTFINEREDLELVSIKIDDGYSGSNFDRPAFKELMEEIKNKEVDCIIVKDFSRFGRNFIEVGKYIEEIFPFMGIRFIAINDNYDSLNVNNSNDIIVPFKNLINDAYLRDISIKIRTQLDSKKKNGDFIGSFATYGYLKDPKNKNKLIVDEYASKIIKEIFKLKLEGFTHSKIANKLNEEGILCPMEYKKHMGLKFSTSFKTSSKAKWNHNTIIRILKNPVYIGVLEQSKFTTLNHKIKNKIENKKDKWIICNNSHQPIIDKDTFDTVQKLMLSDTRIASNNEKLSLFSGILYCGDCGRSLIRKNYGTKEKRYIYYVCSGAVKKTGCTKHSIRDKVIEELIFKIIKSHIKNIVNLEQVLKYIKNVSYIEKEIEKININNENNKNELKKLEEQKFKIYEDYKNGLLDKLEYQLFSKKNDEKIEMVKERINNSEKEITKLLKDDGKEQNFIEYFKKYQNIEKLDRKIIISLIEKIYVYEDCKIEIKFKFQEPYNQVTNFIKNINLSKEVI